MVRKLSLVALALLLLGCSPPEEDKGANLNAPLVKSPGATKEQEARGISPEMAKGMAEPGVDTKH